MKHLIYTTFGEQNGSVYSTQVKQLLNFWSKRKNWKVTLIQIADQEDFSDLVEEVEQIYIKRRFKLLFSFHRDIYIKEINQKLCISLEDTLYFNSRGESAYIISSNYIKKKGLNPKCNNIDIRGTIEEL